MKYFGFTVTVWIDYIFFKLPKKIKINLQEDESGTKESVYNRFRNKVFEMCNGNMVSLCDMNGKTIMIDRSRIVGIDIDYDDKRMISGGYYMDVEKTYEVK